MAPRHLSSHHFPPLSTPGRFVGCTSLLTKCLAAPLFDANPSSRVSKFALVDHRHRCFISTVHIIVVRSLFILERLLLLFVTIRLGSLESPVTRRQPHLLSSSDHTTASSRRVAKFSTSVCEFPFEPPRVSRSSDLRARAEEFTRTDGVGGSYGRFIPVKHAVDPS